MAIAGGEMGAMLSRPESFHRSEEALVGESMPPTGRMLSPQTATGEPVA
jgi:hypothetical protein